MDWSSFDVSSIDPQTRRQLLDNLRKNLDNNTYQNMLEDNTEDGLLKFAIMIMMAQEKAGQPGSSTLRNLRLERMRRRMGDEPYRSFLRTHSEEELLELESQFFTPAPTDLNRRVRTRESTRRLRQIIFLLALAYGALLGAGYPDWAAFSQVFDSIFYWVVGIIFVIGLVLVLFFRTAFDLSNIWLWGLLISALISAVIGLGANLFTIGLKVLGVAALAAVGAYLFGLLFGQPVYRWLERCEKEWQMWVVGILAVLLAAGVLVAGWFGILAVFPVS